MDLLYSVFYLIFFSLTLRLLVLDDYQYLTFVYDILMLWIVMYVILFCVSISIGFLDKFYTLVGSSICMTIDHDFIYYDIAKGMPP